MIEIRHITADISIALLELNIFSTQEGIVAKREQEKAGCLFVLKELLGSDQFQLSYTGHKKPYLAGRTEHISISHSHDKLAVILNRKENTGIDIELLRDKVLPIRHKFLNDSEAAFAGSDIEKLITIWAAKEAMYKFHGLKQLEFKTNISVRDFEDTVIFGKIESGELKKELRLVRERIDNYILVYILHEI